MTNKAEEGHGWQDVVEAAKPAVAELRVTLVRAFHDAAAGLRDGTGFVVDAHRGLLLTNRHVCTCGPQRVSATFVGHPSMEEQPADVVYVDPEHDFALLRVDPDALKQTPLVQLELDPAGCRVGEEICMLGNGDNDWRGMLQIRQGSIARIDRNVPELPTDHIADENTFCVMASTGSSVGASGSPVINKQGRAVALFVCGLAGSMHAFLLPLQRVAHVLKLVQLGSPVPRGTLCTAFSYQSFPDCRRLGVDDGFVQRAVLGREQPAGGTFTQSAPPGGMLVVRQCMPGAAAATVLKPGDVLLELEDQPCVDFVLLESVLDEKVGRPVRLAICRAGQRLEVELHVEDLHRLVPHAFVELGLGVFHEVPYRTAMKHHIPLRGVYVAQAGFVFGQVLSSDQVITAINGVPCHDIASFIEMLEEIHDSELFSVSWIVPGDEKSRRVHEDHAKMQRQWSLFTAWSLHQETRAWMPRRLGGCLRDLARADSDVSTTASPSDEVLTSDEGTASDAPPADDDAQMPPGPGAAALGEAAAEARASPEEVPPAKRARTAKLTGALAALDQSVCSVVFQVVHHFDLDIFPGGGDANQDIVCLRGAGIVVDAERGLVLTDRGTVPQRLGDIEVTLGEESRSACVLHMHPEHSLVVLKLDASPESGERRFGKAASFEQRDFELGEDLEFVGVDDDGRRFSSVVKVQSVRLGKFPRHWPPRWAEKNLEAVVLVEDPPDCTSGVICDARGNIYALYAVFQGRESEEQFKCGYGIPTYVIHPILQQLDRPEGGLAPLVVASLEVEFQTVPLQKLQRLPARLRPSAHWIERLRTMGGNALQVTAAMRTGPCHRLLEVGDLLVAVGGEVVAAVHEVEALLQKDIAGACARSLEARLTILRRGAETDVRVLVPLLASDGSGRVLLWHGLLLQETPRAVESFSSPAAPEGVHISHTFLGSPADAGGIMGDFLVSVDGEPTPNLDAIGSLASSDRASPAAPSSPASPASVESAGSSCERRYLRVESADVAGRRFVSMLETDLLFWPTVEISQNPQGSWSCVQCD